MDVTWYWRRTGRASTGTSPATCASTPRRSARFVEYDGPNQEALEAAYRLWRRAPDDDAAAAGSSARRRARRARRARGAGALEVACGGESRKLAGGHVADLFARLTGARSNARAIAATRDRRRARAARRRVGGGSGGAGTGER